MRFSFAPIAINTITPNDRRRLIVFIATVTPLHKSRHCTLCLHRPHTTLVPDSWSWQIYVPWGQKIAACALCRVGEGREWQRENRRTRGGRETYATEQDSRVTVWLGAKARGAVKLTFHLTRPAEAVDKLWCTVDRRISETFFRRSCLSPFGLTCAQTTCKRSS